MFRGCTEVRTFSPPSPFCLLCSNPLNPPSLVFCPHTHKSPPSSLPRWARSGMAPELTRGVLSAALMLMIKERLYDFNKRMLLKTMRT